ncbi:MAG: SMP-30/gluconolactonase/LRE family protein [Nocardioidaceae bacterium]
MAGSGLFPPDAALTRPASGARWAEGPVWLPDRRAVRFSDIPNNRVLEYLVDTGDLDVYRADAGYSNGRTLDLDGSVVECSHGARAVRRDRDGSVTTVVDSWRGHRLNSPNDVVVKSDRTVWFTDPAYGISRMEEGNLGQTEYGDHFVFRYDPVTQDLDPVVIDVVMPNGLAFSPDESILYVADSSLDPPDREGPPLEACGHSIHAYDVVDGRRAKNGRPFVEVSPGLPDGIRVDVFGNVWTSSLDSVQVFSPSGQMLERVAVPEKVANLCFSDDGMLYIAASTSLYGIRTNVTDAAAQHRTRDRSR